MSKKPVSQEIPEAKIRNAIWYLKTSKTKKFVCDFLGIAYNTKKLDKIIEDFHAREQREKELKQLAKNKIFSDIEKREIAKTYLAGESQSAIASQYYVSPQKIKNILIQMNVPIRGRGKKSEAKVDHIKQDLEVKFNKNEKVFIAKYNCFGIIHTVYDEDYIEFLENGRQRYQELKPFKPDIYGLSGKHVEPALGVHYEIYWQLEDGSELKLEAMKRLRQRIINTIEETGREHYLVWRDDEQGGFYYFTRDNLYPIKAM
jgi:hypothetical protein